MDFTELLAIGRLVISDLLEDESNEYNISYMSTAIKWAIRNELRRRYKWYVAKEDKNTEDKNDREQVYTTILSINELQDQENPVQIVDHSITPDKKCEFEDLNVLIKQSIKKLPSRERSIIESRFYNDKRIKDIAEEFNISPSRISRIIQSGLDKIKKDLQKQEAFC
jgi:RNA polymerase sigma factor (sigma-70 family)